MSAVITLTTDFGTRDPYVAAMKGVLLERCPGTTILDLSHEIAAHDVLEAALFAAAAVPYFPAGTVHLVVVDPGVGSTRRPIAASVAGQFLVGPDNGFLSLLADEHPPAEVHEIVAMDAPRGEVSATFHGRDVFAPAAAALACGTGLEDLGPSVAGAVHLDVPAPRLDGECWHGEVIHVDRFGNAVTNLRRAHLGDTAVRAVRVAGRSLGPVARTYSDAPAGAPLALFDSAGLLEIAVNRGRADEALGLRRGTAVELVVAPTD